MDSLETELLSLELKKAQQLVTETDFWHRLLPRITLSAAWGIREIVFVDPYATVQPLAPKDSYRLDVTLALGDLLDFGRHAKAELDLKSLQTRLHMLHARQEATRIETRRRREVSAEQMRLLKEERKIVMRLLEFARLEYAMGMIAFDALQRAHLQLLALDRAIIATSERMEGEEKNPEETVKERRVP